MPESTTYWRYRGDNLQAWRLGLKAIAIYRDGCKRSQPLFYAYDAKASDEAHGPAVPVSNYRPLTLEDLNEAAKGLNANDELGQKLGMVRAQTTARRARGIDPQFSLAGHEGYLTVGSLKMALPESFFCTMAKESSTISGLMDVFATAISLALQYGVPFTRLVKNSSHTRFEPSGFY